MDPIVLKVTLDNPEGIHPELMRDDVSDVLDAAGFRDLAIDVVIEPGAGAWTAEAVPAGGYTLIQPDGARTGIIFTGLDAFSKAEAEAAQRNRERAAYLTT